MVSRAQNFSANINAGDFIFTGSTQNYILKRTIEPLFPISIFFNEKIRSKVKKRAKNGHFWLF